eukprot:CAMPEP_0171190958 /NCGR_PEP_ID=MMETSP0790-20130122/19119_1 /TAXON_ID=2925 /ORGANISM="Alexandrium catenella, Strain OF101" /LENGTH=243 /DNA_ID=CAMNT_0011656095 /DNA_START=45 /DNA_END=776 /DNA_ORIENTATION=+
MDDGALGEAVKQLVLKNADDEVLTYESHHALDPARQQIMATAFPACEPQKKVIAILASGPNGTKMEHIAVVQDSAAPQLVVGSCQISFEDITPSECVEYCFPEAPSTWVMAQLSLLALETYRGKKFETWRNMLLEPTCEAQFRRMLQIGLVAEIFDPHVFPTPESMKSKYQVTDEKTGKLIELPDPVSALRVWDAEQQAYRSIGTQLKGAPSEAERSSWWADFMKELCEKHGQEYIDGLTNGK